MGLRGKSKEQIEAEMKAIEKKYPGISSAGNSDMPPEGVDVDDYTNAWQTYYSLKTWLFSKILGRKRNS